jgi:hypothetical protein
MYHVCYLVDCEKIKCSGTTIDASSYQDAIKKFQKEHSNQIVYICNQEIFHESIRHNV